MAMVMALALNVACSDDTTKPPKKDTGPFTLDGNGKKDITNVGNEASVDLPIGLETGPKMEGGVPTCSKAIVGKACTKASSGSECGSSGTCLLTSSDGASGVCTCACTPDNTSTPLINEDTCPEATTTKYSTCGKVSFQDGSTKNYCFKGCKPALGKNDCDSPVYCDPRSGGYAGILSQAVCFFSGGCTKNTDCEVFNGKTCDTKDTTKKCTGTGEKCVALTASGTAGLCAVAGKCDVKSGICDKHTLGKSTAKVGDPCKSDLDCGGTQTCQIEFDEKKHLADAGKSCTSNSDCCSYSCVSGTCATGAPCRVRNRNGYCTTKGCSFAKTLTTAACDATSVCNILYTGGYCQKTCDLTSATGCRGNDYSTTNTTGDYLGDYECRAWNNLSFGSTPIVAKSVCDFGETMKCTFLQASKLDCSSVGVVTTNTTKMSCRDETTGKDLTSKYDPKGLCLDNTPSGPVKK